MVTKEKTKVEVVLPEYKRHPGQIQFVDSTYKRIIVRAGRRGGKTVGVAIRNVKRFLEGRRQLYATPTSEQLTKWWYEVSGALSPLVQLGVFKKNETEHFIERPGTEQRIKGKTAWNADTMRGDYADDLTFDEWQLMDEDAWEVVGAPMLLDNNGDVVFIYTPPSLRSAGVSKARDPRHAAKLFKKALGDPRWLAIHFTSHDNPYISREALAELIKDMSKQSYGQEILAEDDEIQLSWLAYKAFNESLCKIPRFDIPKNWDIFSGHDFGSANPAALFFAQVKLPLPAGAPQYMRLNDLVCFKEYSPGGMGAPQHVNAFKEITQGYRVVKSVGGNVTTEEQTRQLYGMHGWSIQSPTITHINAQIDRVIGLMELNKIYCFDDNLNWLEELMNCLWIPSPDGIPTNKIKDEARYHLSACARYILSDFTPETVYSGQGAVAVSNH